MSAESKLQLADAYMQIVPSMKGAQGVIAQSLGGASVEGAKAGSKLGEGMHGGIKGRLASLVPGSGAGIGGALGGSILGAVKRFAAPIAAVAIGFASVEAIKKSTETFEATAGAARTLQRSIGGTVPEVSGLSAALQLGGVDSNKAQTALTIFSKTVGKAGTDSKKTAALTKTLGMSFKDSHGQILPMATLLPKVSDKFAKMPDGPAKTALAMQLFGKQGAAMLPFLNKGSAGMADLTKQAQSMGLVLDDTSITIFGNAKKSAREFKLALQGAGTAMGQDFSVPLDAVANLSRAVLIPALAGVVKVAHAFRPAFLVVGEIGDKVAESLRGLATKAITPVAASISKLAEPTAKFLERFKGAGGVVDHVGDRLLAFAKGSTGQAITGLLQLWQAVSPVGIALKALLPILPTLLDALRTLGAAVAGALGEALRAVLPSVIALAGMLAGMLGKALTALAPVLTVLAHSLAGTLGRSLTILLPLVAQVAVVLLSLATNVLALLQPLLTSPQVILAVAGAFAAWKVAQAGISFVGLIGGLVKSTVQLGINALAWVRQTAAMVASKAQTVILLGMYAGEFVGNVARATGALVAQAAAWVAQKAALIGARVATIAISAAQKAAAVAQWALNAAMNANPIGLVVIAIVALVAGLVIFFTKTKLGQAIWAGFVKAVAASWQWLVGAIRVAWSAITTGISTAVHAVKAVISSVVSQTLAGWRADWALISTVVRVVWSAIKGAVSVALHAVQSVVRLVIGAVSAYIGFEVRAWRLIFSTVWSAIKGAVSVAVHAVQSVVRSVIGAVSGFIGAEVRAWRLIFSTVWAAIRGVVSGGLSAVRSVVSGGLSAVRGAMSGAWSAIRGVVSGAWSAISGAVSRGIGGVVTLARGIGGRVLGAVQGFGTLLSGVGRDVVNGLVNGITGAWSRVTSVVHDLAMKLPEPVRKALGIASPSRVFAAIGNFLGLGLVKGISGTADQVNTAMRDLTSKVVSAFDALAKQRTAAQARLKALDRQLADTSTLTAAGRKRAAALRSQISDEHAAIAQLNRMPSSRAGSALVRTLKADTTKLDGLAKTRDRLVGRLKTAQDKLTAATSTRDDYAAQISGGVTGLGDVTRVQGRTDANGVTAKVTTGDILTNMRAQLAAAGRFQTELATLKAQGLNATTYQQLSESFAQNGDTSTADALIAGGKGSVSTLNSLQAQLTSRAKALGTATSKALYQAGVDTAAASVANAKAKVDDVKGAMGLVEATMANSAKKLGQDVKPLLRQAGADLVAGLTDGLTGKHTELAKGIAALGKKAVDALKKELGIKAPAAAHAAGTKVGTHLAAGVKSTHTKAKAPAAHHAAAPKKAPKAAHPAEHHATHGTTVVQHFNGPMGLSPKQVADQAATKARRALNTVNIPKVVVN